MLGKETSGVIWRFCFYYYICILKLFIMQLYRERPKSIEAIQYDGTEECAIKISGYEDFTGHINYNGKNFDSFFLTTNNGDLKLTPGDYVIKDWYGEYTLMPEKIFNRMYKVFE